MPFKKSFNVIGEGVQRSSDRSIFVVTPFDPYGDTPTAPCPVLTYAVGDDLQQVLCEQQVGQSQQAVQLRRELLQPILRDIQTDQSSQVPQLLERCTLAEHTLVMKCQNHSRVKKNKWNEIIIK